MQMAWCKSTEKNNLQVFYADVVTPFAISSLPSEYTRNNDGTAQFNS